MGATADAGKLATSSWISYPARLLVGGYFAEPIAPHDFLPFGT